MRTKRHIFAIALAGLMLLPAFLYAGSTPPPFAFPVNPALTLPKGCSNGQMATYTAATNRWSCAAATGTGDFLADGSVAMTAILPANLSLQVKNGTDSSGFVDFYEDGSNGTSYMRLYGPAALAGNIFLTLPDTAGATGGQLYFSSANTLSVAAKGDAHKIWKMGASDIPVWSDYTITGGTNTFNITNGTASLDVAAGAALNIDTSLQITTGAVVIAGQAGGSSVTFPSTGTLLAGNGDGSALTGLQFDQFITQGNWKLFYSDGSGDVQELALGAAGTLLQSSATTGAPAFTTYSMPPADCTENQILKANSSGDFVCAADATGGGTTMVNDTVWAAKGDLAVGSANDTGTVLSIGSASTLLKVNSDTPGWTSTTITEAANSLALANGTANMTLGAASVIDVAAGKTLDVNYNLTVNSGNITFTGPFTFPAPGAVGGILYSDGTNWLRLAAGTDGYYLKAKGAAAPEWATVTAATPTVITVADEAADASSFPLFVTAATGDLGPKTDTAFTYDPTSGTLGVTALTAGSITASPSADPTITLKDSDNAAGTAKIFGNSSGGANDIIMSIGVEDSTGESTVYIEVDGVTETIDLIKPVVTTSTLTVGTDLTVTGADITLAAAGVKLTGSNGALTILGLGDGAEEDVKIDLNTTANTIIFSSPASSATTVSFSALNVVTTGTLSGKMPTVVYSADGALNVSTAQAQANTFFVNTYGGTLVMTLPAAEAGMAVCLRNGQGNERILQVHSDGTDYLVLPATGDRNTAANHFASSAAKNAQICLVAVDATDWYITSTVGTWAAE